MADPLAISATDMDPVSGKGVKKKKEEKLEISRDKLELGLYRAQLAMVRTAATTTTLGFALYKLLEEKVHDGKKKANPPDSYTEDNCAYPFLYWFSGIVYLLFQACSYPQKDRPFLTQILFFRGNAGKLCYPGANLIIVCGHVPERLKSTNNQAPLLIHHQHICQVFRHAPFHILFQSVCGEAVVMGGFFGEFPGFVPGGGVQPFSPKACIAMNNKMILHPGNYRAGKLGVFHIYPVFPCSTGQDYVFTGCYKVVAYRIEVCEGAGNNLGSPHF